MEKYVIVPKSDYKSEVFEAESAGDALVDFATIMDTDMNLYFKAIPEGEVSNERITERNIKSKNTEEKIMPEDEFKKKCYMAYQLDWMLSHGLNIQDFFREIKKSIVSQVEENYSISTTSCAEHAMECAYEEFDESGFGFGSLWACYDEFIENEYADPYYMKRLLASMSSSDKMIAYYETYTHTLLAQVPDMQVQTSAGVLNAYHSIDPGQPGICVMLQPAAYEDEIDMAYVSVYEDAGYRTADDEGEMDAVIMSYGDASTENYTHKEIVRRDDIIAALGTGTHM